MTTTELDYSILDNVQSSLARHIELDIRALQKAESTKTCTVETLTRCQQTLWDSVARGREHLDQLFVYEFRLLCAVLRKLKTDFVCQYVYTSCMYHSVVTGVFSGLANKINASYIYRVSVHEVDSHMVNFDGTIRSSKYPGLYFFDDLFVKDHISATRYHSTPSFGIDRIALIIANLFLLMFENRHPCWLIVGDFMSDDPRANLLIHMVFYNLRAIMNDKHCTKYVTINNVHRIVATLAVLLVLEFVEEEDSKTLPGGFNPFQYDITHITTQRHISLLEELLWSKKMPNETQNDWIPVHYQNAKVKAETWGRERPMTTGCLMKEAVFFKMLRCHLRINEAVISYESRCF